MTESVDPTSVVADADVLAADVLLGGAAREAMDIVREHDWVTLVASDTLLADTESVLTEVADPSLARDWREIIDTLRDEVSHPTADHPAVASAIQSGSAHVLSFDTALVSTQAGVTLNRRHSLSIRTPAAFVSVFDADSLYESLQE